MTHRNIYTGRKLELIEERNGKGFFRDGDSVVLCRMQDVTNSSVFIEEKERKPFTAADIKRIVNGTYPTPEVRPENEIKMITVQT